jgi:ribosomal protein S8
VFILDNSYSIFLQELVIHIVNAHNSLSKFSCLSIEISLVIENDGFVSGRHIDGSKNLKKKFKINLKKFKKKKNNFLK